MSGAARRYEVALAFHDDRTLGDGTAAPFDVVDLLTLDADRERIERLTICDDTAPRRASWQAATSTH